MSKLNLKKGFTLVELLVVIVIIGIVASITFVSLNSVRAKARDSKRIADIRQFQMALEMYRNDNGVYPSFATSGQVLMSSSTGVTYMAKIPTAPGSNSNDIYTYQSVSSSVSYTIAYQLEKPLESTTTLASIATPGQVYSPGPSTPSTPAWACGDNVTDIDGNSYRTLLIGSQCWFKDNVRTTKYRDGSAVTNITDATAWSNTSTGAYAWPNNDSATYKDSHGALYNWYAAANAVSLCPTGWHVPSDAEITTLETSAGNSANALKAASPTWNGTDTSGFRATPSGRRGAVGDFRFYFASGDGTRYFFWSTTATDASNGKFRYYYDAFDTIYIGVNLKNYGFSVRCLKD